MQIKLILILCLSSNILLSDAKVIFLRGEVFLFQEDGKKQNLKKGQNVADGSYIRTAKKSIARLKLKNKSIVTIAPDTQFQVLSTENKGPSVLTLLKGKIRAEVEEEKQKSDKMFVKTPSAALGVRGTDFQVSFNDIKALTTLVTFRGEVAMAQIQGDFRSINEVSQIRQVLTPENSVSVRKGQFSQTNKVIGKVNVPTKLNTMQFSKLRENTTFNESNRQNVADKSLHIPRGLPSALLANDNQVAIQTLNQLVGDRDTTQEVPPEGVLDKDNKVFAPPAGGFISPDGQYIPPQPGASIYDPISKTFNPTPQSGGIDPNTGEYLPPEGLVLNENGEFEVISEDKAGEILIPTTLTGEQLPPPPEFDNVMGDVPPPPPPGDEPPPPPPPGEGDFLNEVSDEISDDITLNQLEGQGPLLKDIIIKVRIQ